MAEVAIAASLIQAFGTIQQGRATDAMYKAQAQQTLVQSRSQVLNSRQLELQHRENGVKVLEQMVKDQATINARGAAGALDPFSGSLGNLMTVNLDQGYQDFTVQKDNAFIESQNQTIIQKSAEHQAAIYRAAGKQAKKSAMFSAVTSVGMSFANYGMMGGPGGKYSLFGSPGPAPTIPGAGGSMSYSGFGSLSQPAAARSFSSSFGSLNPSGSMGSYGRRGFY